MESGNPFLPPPSTISTLLQTFIKSEAMLADLTYRQEVIKARHSSVLSELHRRHHPIWGQILKTGTTQVGCGS